MSRKQNIECLTQNNQETYQRGHDTDFTINGYPKEWHCSVLPDVYFAVGYLANATIKSYQAYSSFKLHMTCPI